MFTQFLFALVAVPHVLAAPAPASQDPPCVPKSQLPGVDQKYSTIPLGPGMHYCDDSSPDSSVFTPVDSHSKGEDSNFQSNSSTGTSSSIHNTGSTDDVASGGPSSDDNDEDKKDCDDDNENNDEGSGATNESTATLQLTVPTGGANPGSGANGSSNAPIQPNAGGSSGSSLKTAGAIGSVNNSSTSANAGSGKTFQATITGYGGQCGSRAPACGFLGSQGSYQGAVSAYWNTAGLPGQCGTCWQLNDGTKIDGNKKPAGPIGTTPIVVMIDNTCAPDPSKPTGGPDGFQCNQDAQSPIDAFGSVTVVDLCADNGASDAFFGASGSPPNPGEDGHRAGLAIARITQVDCGTSWKGKVVQSELWSKYQAISGAENAVEVKPGHRRYRE